MLLRTFLYLDVGVPFTRKAGISLYGLETGACCYAEMQGANCVFRMVPQPLYCSPLVGWMGLEVTLIRILPRNQGGKKPALTGQDKGNNLKGH